MSKLSDAKKLTLGADPEFCFTARAGGGLVPAVRLFNTNGEEDDNGDYIINRDGEFGLDGCSDIAELRPKPSADPYVLVENIRKALGIGYTKIPELKNYTWLASPSQDEYPMGGHIHLGYRSLPKGAFPNKINNGTMTELLDLYLAVPGILVEPKYEADERRGDYGGLGDWRRQPWGMEYRTLSTWLSHPAVALSVLCLAKTVAVEGLMHGRALRAVSSKDLNVLYNETGTADKAMRAKLLPIVYSRLTKFELYPLYKDEIGFLMDMIHSNNSTLTRGDMKSTWELNKFSPKIVKPKPKSLSQLFKVKRGTGLAARLSAAAQAYPQAAGELPAQLINYIDAGRDTTAQG